MTRVDLDCIDEMSWTFPPEGWDREFVLALAAELRAAREVVEAVRGTYLFGSAAEALAAYDQVVGS